MFDLSGKTAVVTGASGGIGSAIARALSRSGAAIALSGTRVDVLESVAREMHGESRVFAADLAEAAAAERLIRAVEDAFGGVDILIHNAGITRDGLVLRMSDAGWQHVLDVNLTAGFRLARAALRGMMKRRWGRIVGITSVVGVTGNAGQSNYAASKAGMIGMIKSLAQEVATRGITANCVAPGFIESEMTRSLADDRKAAILGAIPAGRAGTPDDVAAAVLFLASSEASYVTGHTLHINGGMAML
jgi:3-oxoacyl-[acyl-carrier protein] reductase